MADVINVHKINREICEALGLDSTRVRSITMCFDHGPPTVDVELMLTDGVAVKVSDVLKQYRLEEIE